MQMFGREAAKLLNYVECFPAGYKKGTKILKACVDARIEGFPTWVINGQVRKFIHMDFTYSLFRDEEALNSFIGVFIFIISETMKLIGVPLPSHILFSRPLLCIKFSSKIGVSCRF